MPQHPGSVLPVGEAQIQQVQQQPAARMEKLSAAVADFEPLPFDAEAASRYPTLVAAVIAEGRSPRPRRLDLMIAATTSIRDLPLYTRNPDDFRGLHDSVAVVAV